MSERLIFRGMNAPLANMTFLAVSLAGCSPETQSDKRLPIRDDEPSGTLASQGRQVRMSVRTQNGTPTRFEERARIGTLQGCLLALVVRSGSGGERTKRR